MSLKYMLVRGAFISFCCTSCAVIPDMPPDLALPVHDIILHAACELRAALISIRQTNPSFKSSSWAIAISLTPKIDTELSIRGGLTGKTAAGTPLRFGSWILGAAPGVEMDSKGHRDGSASYSLHASQLLDAKKYPLQCDNSSVTYHVLARNLGIQD